MIGLGVTPSAPGDRGATTTQNVDVPIIMTPPYKGYFSFTNAFTHAFMGNSNDD